MLVCPACGGTSHVEVYPNVFECTSTVVVGVAPPSSHAPVGSPIPGMCGRQFTVFQSEESERQADAARRAAHDRRARMREREPAIDDLSAQIEFQRSLQSHHERLERVEFLQANGTGQRPTKVGDAVEVCLSVLAQAIELSEPEVIADSDPVPSRGRWFSRPIAASTHQRVEGWKFPVRYSNRFPAFAGHSILGACVTKGGRAFLVVPGRPMKVRTFDTPSLESSSGEFVEPYESAAKSNLQLVAETLAMSIAAHIVDPDSRKSWVGYTPGQPTWIERELAVRPEDGREIRDKHGYWGGYYTDWPEVISRIRPTPGIPVVDDLLI